MPALQPVPKVIRFDLNQTIGADTFCRDRIFLQYSGALSTADLTTIINTLITAWSSNIKTNVTNNNALTSVVGTDLTNASAAQVITTTNQTGTVVGNAVPGGVAAIVKFKIARRYRGGHPRFYLGGVASANQATGNTWSSGFQNTLTTAFGSFISSTIASPPAAVGTLAHVSVSYFAGFTNKTFPSGRVRPVPTARPSPGIDPVLGYSVNIHLGSQRRRNQQSP